MSDFQYYPSQGNLPGDESLRNEDFPIDAPDDSPILQELGDDDFPAYFSERDGRLFHANEDSAYPLPADTPEQERLSVTHAILNRIIGGHYVGPVPEILQASTQQNPKLVLDLCTGAGRWVMDMARQFPNVLFRGVDIVPIATRYPLPNVRFEVHNVNDGLRWYNASLNIVHARSVSMAINNYPSMLQEVARVLQTGGLFLSGEWDRKPTFHPQCGIEGVDVERAAPKSTRFFNALSTALLVKRIFPIAGTVHTMLQNTGLFHSIIVDKVFVPIGSWHPRYQVEGRAFRASLKRYANSVKPLLKEVGRSDEEVEEITEDYLEELKTVRGLVSVYHIVHARRW